MSLDFLKFFPVTFPIFPVSQANISGIYWERGCDIFKCMVFYYSFGPSSANPRSALSLVSSRCLAEEEAAATPVGEGIAQKHGGNSVKFGY